MKKILVGAVVLLVLIAAAIYINNKKSGDISDVPAAADYKNATYNIDGQSIVLQDGVSEIEIISGAASKLITRYFGNKASGDIDGDGTEDVVFLLTQDAGGSGTFFYVVAALKTDAGYHGTNGILLGDRIAPQTTEIRDGEIIVNYAERQPGEPMTAQPSLGVSRYLKIEGSELKESR